jgi:type VI secretion system FHA domain protein
MSLTLTVLSFKNRPINEISPVFIDSEGGSIGRSDDNTLMLPDTEKFVSRHHASIKMENGCYYLTDTSLSGVFINGSEPALHNATARIENGTLLRIGEYEIAVSIANESAFDDFPFTRDRTIPEPKAFLSVDEPWVDMDDMGFNSLMADNFPSHEELVQPDSYRQPAKFESHLQDNQSPLFDSYIAPEIIPASTPAPVAFSAHAVEQIPEDFSFDDLFASHETTEHSTQPVKNPTPPADFDQFFSAAVSQTNTNPPIESPEDTSSLAALFADNEVAETVAPSERKPAITVTETNTVSEYNKLQQTTSPTDSALFNAFLQGAAVDCEEIHPEQQAETLLRIGQMFRKLIDGTIAVLRSRAEFKSLCRVNMTVIRATNNNPLKFTVSTDDVLRQLLENKTDGFIASTVAIEEAFDDVMNHQLAMQAGIQASLTHLLHTFDPKVIEKQFEYGMVLQKKAKCWEKYEETYHNTVDDAVENFFGEEFVKAYEKQMALLKNPHGK